MKWNKPNRGLGKRLREYRLSREWNQTEASIYFCVSVMTIARLEAGKPCTDMTRAKIETRMNNGSQDLKSQQAVA